MPFAKKPKIRKVCGCCAKECWVTPKRAKKFIFCSNKCKWKAKKEQIPHNKIIIQKRTFVRCTSVFCNRGKYLRPFEVKKRKTHFCSSKCYNYFRSKAYLLDIAATQVKKQDDVKRNIWRL